MDKINLVDCKRELLRRGADTKGTKACLLDRLRTLLEQEGSNIDILMSQVNEYETNHASAEQNSKVDDSEPIIRPEDSASQISKQSRQTSSSFSSSVRVTRAKAAAKKAGLLAKARILELKRQKEREELELKREREKEELRLQQEKEELDIQAEIAEIDAREKVLSDLESNVSRRSRSISASLSKRTPAANLNVHAQDFRPCLKQIHVPTPQTDSYQPPNVSDKIGHKCNVQELPHKRNPPRQSLELGYSTGEHNPRNTNHAKYSVPFERSISHVNHSSYNSLDNQGANKTEMPSKVKESDSQMLETLVSFNLKSLMPKVEVQIFSGECTHYKSFIRSFETIISSKLNSEEEKLYYLEQYTKGVAQDIVRACLHMAPDVGYQEARRLLHNRYGKNERIASAYIEKVINSPSIKANDVEDLNKFSILLETCKNAFSDMPFNREIEHPKTILAVIEKLPIYMQDRWRRRVDDINERECRGASFGDLVDMVTKEARISSNPLYGKHMTSHAGYVKKTDDQKKPFTQSKQVSAKVNLNVTDKVSKSIKCYFCEGNHYLDDCKIILKKSMTERKEFIRTRGFCFKCLTKGHRARECRRKRFCKVCKGLHPTILHHENRVKAEAIAVENHPVNAPHALSNNTSKVEVGNTEAIQAPQVNVGAIRKTSESNQKMCIIPVKVRASNGQLFPTYAFLDNGSTASFCTENLMQKLGLHNSGSARLSVSTVQPNGVVMDCYIVTGMEICDLDENNFISLPPVYTLEKIPVSNDDIIKNEDLKEWPHLQQLDIPELNLEVGLMIGNNVPHAIEPWEIINSPNDGAPFAYKTKLGWVVCGSSTKTGKLNVRVNRVKVNDGSIDQMFENLYNQDVHDLNLNKRGYSEEDRQWIKQAERSCIQQSDGHYEIALPFRDNIPNLANNKSVAFKRLEHLKTKFQKDPCYFSKYSDFVEDLFIKGYAEPVAEENGEVESGKWYMPHHGVVHPQKPEKVRVVFDCASKYRGTSLNDHLLQGPDLANSLIEVLIRFRQGAIAFVADIESMFYQVRVPPSDRDFLRFLWFPGGDLNKPPGEYRMTTHVFGATSSPSCANFALRKTANDHGKVLMQNSTKTILNNFYVDDCLKSTSNEDEAIRSAHEVQELCMKGGFKLTKFISNSRALLQTFPSESQSKTVRDLDICRDSLPTERALGIHWNVELDVFTIAVQLKEKPFTKRGVLSTIGAMYDPLGMVCPSILGGKMIMQELCRLHLHWDEEIPEKLQRQWVSWRNGVSCLSSITLERNFTPINFSSMTCQLHNFSDASERGYGCVSYLRFQDHVGNIQCSFIFGKSRVAPLKTVTIPRLELMAATLSAKVNMMIEEALEIKLEKVVFWTDSTSVLRCIRNDKARFHTFVANRLAVIKDLSHHNQWRYVDSQNNPADDASRGHQTDRWLKGPDFLLENEEQWPLDPCSELTATDDLEIKVHATINKPDEHSPTQRLINYFSNWHRLKKSVAWLIRFKCYLRGLKNKTAEVSKHLSVIDLEEAETSIISFVQRGVYNKEITALREQKLNLNSPLTPLKPIVGKELLLVGGRLSNAPLEFENKHPIILPYKHQVTDLIIRDYHEKSGHSGRQHVLSLLREKFWIIKGNAAVRRVLNGCMRCRRIQAPVMEQQMAELPRDCVTPDEPPFTRTGVDCFGPFYVKRGRAQVKRYGVLFTCLVTRAIHIEIADSLSTDSFINALRRFVARRGQVKVMRSDRGTNFIGAEKELKEAISNWNEKCIHETLLIKGIDWCFNPPYASHFGGRWERMIRSVRKTLNGLLKEQLLNDDSLMTLMCEVEAIVNSRPLTISSEDCNDYQPITPNLLLTLRGNCMDIGMFNQNDSYSKKRWKHVQYLADLFWSRWKKEYLSNLQIRQKWTQTRNDLKKGDLVLLVEENVARCHWSLGRVSHINRSTDGFVRSAKVTCNKGLVERPISKLVLLCSE